MASDIMAGGLEVKAGAWEVKALDDDGNFRIYFAAFENIDRGGDVIEPGAFKNLDEYDEAGWVGVNHDMEKLPVAYPTGAVQDAKGLLISGRFHSHAEAQACRAVVKERMAAGKKVYGSIGYRVPQGGAVTSYLDGKAVRRLKAIDLFECSFVNLPMNPRAEAVSAKSLEAEPMNDDDAQAGGDERKVLPLEALNRWLDERLLEAKAGRTISRSTHASLKAMHGELDGTCKKLGDFLDRHDPEGRPDEPDGDEKDAIDRRRAAGNSIPADQLAGGAVTAGDLKARKEDALRRLRERAVRDQIRFAMLSH